MTERESTALGIVSPDLSTANFPSEFAS